MWKANYGCDAKFQKVCDLDDVWEGEMDVFDVGNEEVLIVHAPGGKVRAFHPSCPHQEHPLVDGDLENCILTCNAHLWQFDVISGEGTNPTGTVLTSYPVKTEDKRNLGCVSKLTAYNLKLKI